MKKFLALFLAPIAVLDEWMQKPAEEREEAEKTMRTQWDAWASAHASQIVETMGAGKTKKVTPNGIEDSRNDVMLYCVVQAESHDEAAKLFEGHPHLTIPQATIEVMQINPLTSGE